MAVNPIERAMGRFLLGPVLRVVKVGGLLLMVGLGFKLSFSAFAFLTTGEWARIPYPIPGLLDTLGLRIEPLAWLVVYLGIVTIALCGGQLLYHREIAHYRRWRKQGGDSAAETNPETSSV